MVLLHTENPSSFQNSLLSSFQRPTPSGADAPDGLDGKDRRGMLLIQGEVLLVNDVRRFFQRHHHHLPNQLILQPNSANLAR
jgi:hypothetical protein